MSYNLSTIRDVFLNRLTLTSIFFAMTSALGSEVTLSSGESILIGNTKVSCNAGAEEYARVHFFCDTKTLGRRLLVKGTSNLGKKSNEEGESLAVFDFSNNCDQEASRLNLRYQSHPFPLITSGTTIVNSCLRSANAVTLAKSEISITPLTSFPILSISVRTDFTAYSSGLNSPAEAQLSYENCRHEN